MAEITAALVKELREKTGAGMMDCKKALTETAGEMEEAVDWLRKNGLAAAAKKAGRIAAEGLIGVATRDGTGSMVEINAETDFVARNETFQNFVRNAAELALDTQDDIEALTGSAYPDGGTLGEQLTSLIATIGENMSARRTVSFAVSPGVVSSYVHKSIAPGLGNIGVLVALESSGDTAKLNELGRQIAMHIAATSPACVDIDDLSPELLARERNILIEQAKASGRPDNIIEKMVEGRIRKFYEESVLLEQTYVIDGETKVRKVVEDAAKEMGAPIKIIAIARFGLGEGLEREESDFASEVAAVSRG